MKDFKSARNKICTKIDTIDKLRRKLKVVKPQEVNVALLAIQVNVPFIIVLLYISSTNMRTPRLR